VVEETGVPIGEGYERAVLGAHDADVDLLVARLREIAAAEIGKLQIEPNPHGEGWLLVDDAVEGRLVWSDDYSEGEMPYKVVVDGRLLTWSELGSALGAYEGWRFRIELADRADDLRPDADVIALQLSGADDATPERADIATIDDILIGFLADQRERLAPRTYGRYDEIVGLLRSCLNNYGYEELDEVEQARLDAAYEHDEEAFVHLFGPEKLVGGLAGFLGDFMVRKVMAGEDLLRAAGTVTKRLGRWLEENRYVDSAVAADVEERGADAARYLPRADRLASILYDLAESSDVEIDFDALDEGDVVDEYLTIERVEPRELWFERGIGPVKVPKTASDLARPGWSVNVVLARVLNSWQLVEVGNVYP
jgi:hypothetical protein